MNAMSRETTLRNYLSQVKDRYDFVLIDCMPSLSMVTLNALSGRQRDYSGAGTVFAG